MGDGEASDFRLRLEMALERVPDDPWRVDTRGMLLSGRAEVACAPAPESAADGFVVSMPDAALVSIVGHPPRPLIRHIVEELEGDPNVLCQPAEIPYVASALPGWRRTGAILHTLGARPDWSDDPEPDARIFHAADAPSLAHVPPPLRRELIDALRGRPTSRFVPGALPYRDAPPLLEGMPIAASWQNGMPVSFCYPVLRTETWWDISIETLPNYRRRGHAARAVRTMTRHMWRTGRSPVWGASYDNLASLALAENLGFEEVGRLCVFTPPLDG